MPGTASTAIVRNTISQNRRNVLRNRRGMRSVPGHVSHRRSVQVARATNALDALTTVRERAELPAGATVSRERLARDVLDREYSPFDRSIDTHICNLRASAPRARP